MPSRRRVLASSTAILSGCGLAGCLASGEHNERDDPVDLCRLEVSNKDTSPHEVSVRVTEGDRELYSRDEEVDAIDGNILGGFSVPSAELPGEPGTYLVRARLNDDDWEELYLPDVVSERAAVIAMIEPASDGPSLALLYGNNPNACSE